MGYIESFGKKVIHEMQLETSELLSVPVQLMDPVFDLCHTRCTLVHITLAGSLKKILKKIVESKDETERNQNLDPLMEIVMLIQFANDECDYGEGLELGLDLFSFTADDCFRNIILSLLPLAYQFLNRDVFAKIIEAHLANRKRTAELSMLS